MRVVIHDELENTIEMDFDFRTPVGEIRAAVNKKLPAGFEVGEEQLVPSPYSRYMYDSPEPIKGPPDEYAMGDVFYELIAHKMLTLEETGHELPRDDVVVRMGSVVPLANTPAFAVCFPGQGAQRVGMAKKLLESAHGDKVRELFGVASEVLGYDLLDLCLNGPAEKLNDTEYSQLAVMVTSLAAMEVKLQEDPSLARRIKACAGFSLGEYTALIFAGAITLEEGILLVKKRAEAMSAATKMSDGSMVSVVGMDDEKLDELLGRAMKQFPDEKISVANYLFPKGYTCSGGKKCCKWVAENATVGRGALSAREVKVSGAFHTEYMAPANEALAAAIEEADLSMPIYPVYSNVTAEPYKNVKDMKALLLKQMTSPVKWEQTFNVFLEIATGFIEPGPGEQLKAMMKRIDKRAFENFVNLPV